MAEKKSNNVLVRISGWFYSKWKFTLALWLIVVIGGASTYSYFIKKEGFPPIQFPLTVVSGTYFVDDVKKVDADITSNLATEIAALDGVESSNLTAGSNFFSIVVQFKGDVAPAAGTEKLRGLIDSSNLPSEANLQYTTIDPASFLNRYDMLLTLYSVDAEESVEELQRVAEAIAGRLQEDELITAAETQNLITSGVNPANGQTVDRQTAFSRFGTNVDGKLGFYSSVVIGVDRDAEKIDIIELSDLMRDKVAEIDVAQYGDQFRLAVGADFAESIDTQINSLESNLLSGLVAVAVVSLLLITWRASIITGIFMVSVMAAVIGVLYLVGYTLNTITLFALVLSLGLFVDDATIVVEALDASRKKKKKSSDIVKEAISKVGAASFAGTTTTVLVFLPLAFISGILGEFIRLMPVTIILSLVSSFILSMTVIPLFARFLLLRSDKVSWLTRVNPVSKFEVAAGRLIGRVPLLLKTSPRKGKVVALSMFALSFVFIFLSTVIAQNLSFNIFPLSKDSDQIGFQISFPQGTNLKQAEQLVDQVNAIIKDEAGDYSTRVLYGSFNQPNERGADALIELVPFTERDIKSPQLIDQLDSAFTDGLPSDVKVRVIQYDAGPPPEEYPFKMQVFSDDESKALSLAEEIRSYLQDATVTRTNGETAKITEVKQLSTDTISRKNGKKLVQVEASFDADDTSALVQAAEKYAREQFTDEYLQANGFAPDDVQYDFGQESSNEDSFASLGLIFPLALAMMYVLLALQFRSFLQPLLIFMAIPFSLFGVFGGLYLTDNSLSFFSMIGLIGLIGIAVNNTILLTDYANQERRLGHDAIESISQAASKRFRPLLTTTLTTVVALLPLAMSDPFWEALAYTIIFGLLSSTFLVLLSFPYYYLAAEWLRNRVRRSKKA